VRGQIGPWQWQKIKNVSDKIRKGTHVSTNGHTLFLRRRVYSEGVSNVL
jgi:hypothetical protein